MTRYLPIALVALALSVPATASADVTVLSSEGDELVSFKSAQCRKATSKKAILQFIATAKTRGWRLSVNIAELSNNIMLGYGGDGPADFTVTGPSGSWTNLNRPPDAPPGGGAIVFSNGRKRMGLGFQPAFNRSFTSSVGVGGGLKCIYPKKKKKKK